MRRYAWPCNGTCGDMLGPAMIHEEICPVLQWYMRRFARPCNDTCGDMPGPAMIHAEICPALQ